MEGAYHERPRTNPEGRAARPAKGTGQVPKSWPPDFNLEVKD